MCFVGLCGAVGCALLRSPACFSGLDVYCYYSTEPRLCQFCGNGICRGGQKNPPRTVALGGELILLFIYLFNISLSSATYSGWLAICAINKTGANCPLKDCPQYLQA